MRTLDDKNEDKNPKVTAVDWTPDGDAILVQYGEPDRWERGISRLDLKTKTLTTLVRDANLYQGFRQSRDGSTIVFQKSDGTRPAELFADAGFTNVRKLTDLNPSIAKKALPASELVSYRDADGKVLYGVLRYPISGDQDPNVPASQSREVYYALRRLGKEVEWVRYTNGGHRPPNSVAESIDFEKRIVAWYDKYLKAKPAQTTSSR